MYDSRSANSRALGILWPGWDGATVGLPAGGGSCGSLGCGLGDDVGLVDGALDDLLFLGIEVLGEVLVEGRLFLLKSCNSLTSTY